MKNSYILLRVLPFNLSSLPIKRNDKENERASTSKWMQGIRKLNTR